jgi:hypothetical protein
MFISRLDPERVNEIIDVYDEYEMISLIEDIIEHRQYEDEKELGFLQDIPVTRIRIGKRLSDRQRLWLFNIATRSRYYPFGRLMEKLK